MMNKAKEILKNSRVFAKIQNIYRKVFFKIIGLKDVILFESKPDFIDNTLMVFNELVNRGLNEKYRFIWVLNDKKNTDTNMFSNVKNVEFVYIYSLKFRMYYSHIAKVALIGNEFFNQIYDSQLHIYLAHGGAFKRTLYYTLPKSYKNASVISISKFLADYDAINLDCSREIIKPLGFPRNDLLINSHLNLNKLFKTDGCKFIYWMPTYRTNSSRHCSDVEMPIIHNEQDALAVNEIAKKNNVFIIAKPHFAQDLDNIKMLKLSNIMFIDNNYLKNNNIENYALLGSCDALLTDYSSVYYDYLICNKPIGLCWEDFEQYRQNNGFVLDPEEIMSPGEKIMNIDDMSVFIEHVANGVDINKAEREKMRDKIHDYADGNSTKRVTDYIESVL